MSDVVMAMNRGSSSLKFALYDMTGAGRPLLRGEIESMGERPRFHAVDAGGAPLVEHPHEGGGKGERDWPRTEHELIARVLDWVVEHLGGATLRGIGHRVVHGGTAFDAPVRVTEDVISRLEALTPFAPLHQPASLAPMRAIRVLRPDLVQVACFDTGFHRTMPDVASRLALPRRYGEKGVRRYGFHGLSYEHIALRLASIAPDLARGRVIVAHLGSGASLCALRQGVSIETSMGFSALDGLVMATRCGHLDPGVLLYMMGKEGLDEHAIEDILYRQSGLLGVSGLSPDIRILQEQPQSEAAREALELFVYRIVQECGRLIAVLGGIDGLVFTAGIGEHGSWVRAQVCARLQWLGLVLDEWANDANAPVISAPGSRVEVRVEAADEEEVIRRDVIAILGGA